MAALADETICQRLNVKAGRQATPKGGSLYMERANCYPMRGSSHTRLSGDSSTCKSNCTNFYVILRYVHETVSKKVRMAHGIKITRQQKLFCLVYVMGCKVLGANPKI